MHQNQMFESDNGQVIDLVWSKGTGLVRLVRLDSHIVVESFSHAKDDGWLVLDERFHDDGDDGDDSGTSEAAWMFRHLRNGAKWETADAARQHYGAVEDWCAAMSRLDDALNSAEPCEEYDSYREYLAASADDDGAADQSYWPDIKRHCETAEFELDKDQTIDDVREAMRRLAHEYVLSVEDDGRVVIATGGPSYWLEDEGRTFGFAWWSGTLERPASAAMTWCHEQYWSREAD